MRGEAESVKKSRGGAPFIAARGVAARAMESSMATSLQGCGVAGDDAGE
jgi:hypothetical protein